MKKITLFLVFLLILMISACNGKDISEEKTYANNDKEFIYLEELSVFDKGIITQHLKNGANLHETAAIGEA